MLRDRTTGDEVVGMETAVSTTVEDGPAAETERLAGVGGKAQATAAKAAPTATTGAFMVGEGVRLENDRLRFARLGGKIKSIG